MIEVKLINKSFEGNPILNDVSAKFEQGKTNLIIGQSGSGKTVLLKCLLGLHEPDNGEVLFDGISTITSLERSVKDSLCESVSVSKNKNLHDELSKLSMFFRL